MWVVRVVCAGLPALHTLRLSSLEPETIVLPSGEKATESTQWLCAFCFSATKARDEASARGEEDVS